MNNYATHTTGFCHLGPSWPGMDFTHACVLQSAPRDTCGWRADPPLATGEIIEKLKPKGVDASEIVNIMSKIGILSQENEGLSGLASRCNHLFFD